MPMTASHSRASAARLIITALAPTAQRQQAFARNYASSSSSLSAGPAACTHQDAHHSKSSSSPSTSSNAALGQGSLPNFPCVDANELRAQRLQQEADRQRASASASRHSATTTATNPSVVFPCIDANEARAQRLRSQGPAIDSTLPTSSSSDDGGPEPAYSKVVSGYKLFHYPHPFDLDYGGQLPLFQLAYETWGTLNADKSNAILLHTGLSASSHAASTPSNPAKGWWEAFIGPGKPLDTEKYFVVCTNVLGGCYGSTGPSSPDPASPDGSAYATRFPILSIFDMVRAQFALLDDLGIEVLYASVGSSMGGMQSVAAAHLEPTRVARIVSISGCARSNPASIALRFAQRSVLMSDPNWNRGFYYAPGSLPPHTGMKLARQIATITYRSGPEWEQRFGRGRRRAPGAGQAAPPSLDGQALQHHGAEQDPALCPDFLIETYLDHQGEQFCLKYDANSLIYISKAMDLFDMSDHALNDLSTRRARRVTRGSSAGLDIDNPWDSQRRMAPTSPEVRIASTDPSSGPAPVAKTGGRTRQHISTLSSPAAHAYVPALARGLRNLSGIPTLVLGVQSDILFPVEQQRELAECLRMNGNSQVSYYEIDAPHGHDSFLIDVANVGGAIKGFLS